MANVAIVEDREVARPLRMIEGLIKEQLKAADEAAQDAAKPYYEKVAPLLVEAKEGHFQGDTTGFYEWAQKKFGKSQSAIRTYLAYRSAQHDKPFKNIEEFKREKSPSRIDYDSRRRSREWTAPVDDIAERARREAFRLAQDEALTRAQEREAEKKLGHRLIDIGYKVLAKELHPDKLHGDKTAFQRLNRVRDQLKHSI